MKLGAQFVGKSPAAAIFLFFIAFAVSIVGAYVFYLLIERPSVELTKRLKRKPKTLEPPSGFAGPVTNGSGEPVEARQAPTATSA